MIFNFQHVFANPTKPAAAAAAVSRREPRFVPYEPYKAAVTSLTVTPLKVRRKVNKSLSSSEEDALPEDASYQQQHQPQQPQQQQQRGGQPAARLDSVSSNPFSEKVNEEMAREVVKLRTELEEKDKQLRIQLQVRES